MRGIQVPWMLKQPNAYSSLWHDTCINFENYYYGINNYLKAFYSKFKTNPLGFGHKYASGDAMDDVSIKIYCCNYTKIALITQKNPFKLELKVLLVERHLWIDRISSTWSLMSIRSKRCCVKDVKIKCNTS